MQTATDAGNSLAGVRVFVAEDEFPVLQLIEDMLEDLGCRLAASVTSVSAALEAAETAEADVAVLDLNLRGHSAFPVATVLSAAGSPSCFRPATDRPDWKASGATARSSRSLFRSSGSARRSLRSCARAAEPLAQCVDAGAEHA